MGYYDKSQNEDRSLIGNALKKEAGARILPYYQYMIPGEKGPGLRFGQKQQGFEPFGKSKNASKQVKYISENLVRILN